jgi:hypothetical protein
MPHLSLHSYGQDDADLLLGRERLVAAVLYRLETTGLACVIGVSESGTSSVLQESSPRRRLWSDPGK